MLSTVKAYLKIDYSIEDELIKVFIEAAKQLILDTTGVSYNEADEVYKLLICYLAAHYYENRQAVGEKNMTEMPYTIQHLMAHIGVRGGDMNPGKYKHRAEILEKRPAGKKNKLDEEIFENYPVKSLFVNFENKTGSMLYGRPGDSKLSKTTHKIQYRFQSFPNLNEDNLIRINGQTYKIEYIDNLDNKNEIMEVFLSRDNLRGK